MAAQILEKEASYYDQYDQLYKIERKYVDTIRKNQNYIRIRKDEIISIKRSEYQRNDTLIVEEVYYRFLAIKSRIDSFRDAPMTKIWLEENSDTVKISFHIYADDFKCIGDTFIVTNIKEYLDSLQYTNYIDEYLFSQHYTEHNYLDTVLTGKFDFNNFIIQPIEEAYSYYVNNKLVKVEFFNNNKQHSEQNCTYGTNNMICKRYFHKDSIILYQIDSLIWNHDTSIVMDYTSRLDWEESYMSIYSIWDQIIQYTDESYNWMRKYMEVENMLNELILSNILYNDQLFSIALYRFDRIKENSFLSARGDHFNYTYLYDNSNRITEQKKFRNNELSYKVVYTFF